MIIFGVCVWGGGLSEAVIKMKAYKYEMLNHWRSKNWRMWTLMWQDIYWRFTEGLHVPPGSFPCNSISLWIERFIAGYNLDELIIIIQYFNFPEHLGFDMHVMLSPCTSLPNSVNQQLLCKGQTVLAIMVQVWGKLSSHDWCRRGLGRRPSSWLVLHECIVNPLSPIVSFWLRFSHFHANIVERRILWTWAV